MNRFVTLGIMAMMALSMVFVEAKNDKLVVQEAVVDTEVLAAKKEAADEKKADKKKEGGESETKRLAGAAEAGAILGAEALIVPQIYYFTPNVISATIAGIIWLIFACTGCCCLMQVQSPAKFVEKGLQLNKEF